MERRCLGRATGRPVLVRIGDAKAPGVELTGFLEHIGLAGVVAKTCHVECEGIAVRLACDHPGCERKTNTAALAKTRHHSAGRPVVRYAGHGTHKRVTVRRERERPVHDFADSCGVKGRKAGEPLLERPRQAIEVRRQQIGLPVVPRGTAHGPWRSGRLVHTEQDTAPLLAHVHLAIEVHDDRQLLGGVRELREVLGDQVVVLHRHQRQLDADHATDLASPESTGVDDVFGLDRALVGRYIPAATPGRREREHASVAVDFRAVQPCCLCECVRCARWVEVALHRVIDRAEHIASIHNRTKFADLGWAHEPRVEAERLVPRDIRPQQIPPLLRGSDVQPTRIMQADVLPGDPLQLRIECDRIGLQARHGSVAVEGVKGAGSVPTRAGGQFLAFTERDIPPPELGQVVEDAAADDSASDDKYPDVALHGILLRRQPDTRRRTESLS